MQRQRALSPTPGPADALEPAHLIVPEGITTNGYRPISALLDALAVPRDPWQDTIGRYMFAMTDDGVYAAQTVGVSVARQSGKTFITYMTQIADCIANPGTFVVWSAHHSSVATEAAREMLSVCSAPKFSRHIDQRTGLKRAIGREEIVFRNGSRIVFKARERGAMRGVPKVRKLILDEAQILGESVLPDMLPTLNAATNPQIIMVGTPPKPGDSGEAFTQLRKEALSGESDDVFYIEYTADPDLSLDDRAAWAQANPAFASGRVPERAIARLRKRFTNDDDFAREALGRWDRADNGEVITEDVWEMSEDITSQIASDMALAIEVGPDAAYASLCIAGTRIDGRAHIELVEQRKGTSWVVPYVRGFLTANPGVRSVVLDLGSSARVLVDDFTREKIKLTHPRVMDVGDACLRIVDGLASGEVVHIGQPQMNISRQGARKRALGTEGMWAWSRKSSVSDITPIVAATLALWGSQTLTVNRPTVTRKGGKVVIPW